MTVSVQSADLWVILGPPRHGAAEATGESNDRPPARHGRGVRRILDRLARGTPSFCGLPDPDQRHDPIEGR